MAEITAALVKQLRERTGAGMMECKKALEEANGNLDDAVDVLRKRGIASAAKKASRSTKQGSVTIALNADRSAGSILEFNCESDFVARTEDFQTMVNELTQQALEAPLGTTRDQMLEQPYRADATQTVGQIIAGKIGKIGENMQLARFEKVEGGLMGSYIHPGAQLGVLVQVTGGSAATASNEEVQELLRDVAMQVAAADPQFVRRDEVTTAVLEKEREIQRERARQEGKPEKVIEKMIEGRMSKFFEEFCLLEQPFIKDNAVTVGQLVADKAKKLGEPLSVARFVRYKVGETAPAEAPAEA
ncbi:MAG TPA: translation elongation factor Ts [Bryobacteraceae bacterium]|nr:translation elongation factor Ts [Bryobacteraceae bacterium]